MVPDILWTSRESQIRAQLNTRTITKVNEDVLFTKNYENYCQVIIYLFTIM